MFTKRSQTATEYLVIIAVVIIIALIVLSILGAIPSIGGGSDSSIGRVAAKTANVGITDYSLTNTTSVLILRNNLNRAVTVTNIAIESTNCTSFSDIFLRTGRSYTYTCTASIDYEGYGEVSVYINYTDEKSGAEYAQDGIELSVSSDVVVQFATPTYMSTLENHATWNSSINGCWNWTQTGDTGAICTCFDLQTINSNSSTLGSNYIMLNDIDVARCSSTFGGDAVGYAANWTPIGTAGSEFNGSFDGASYTFSNMIIDSNGTYYLGMFGDAYVSGTNAGDFHNIGVLNVSIVGYDYVGALVGFARSSNITNSYSTGTITTRNNGGGLVGKLDYGYISNSYSSVDIIGNTGAAVRLGGLVGYGPSSSITNSYATGLVNATQASQIGGLISTGANISNSYATGNIYCGGNGGCGGLMGTTWNSDIVINQSYATGNVTSTDDNVGGLVGYIFVNGIVTNSYSTGDISGTNRVGGLVGYSANTNYTNSYATGNTTCTTNYCGGLVGESSSNIFLGTNNWTNTTGGSPGYCLGNASNFPAGTSTANCTAI